MKNYYLLVLMLVCASVVQATEFCVYEANYPAVRDHNVRIDDATLVVHPRGLYVEFDMYLTVSYDFNSWFFKNYNELEFLWNFSLPQTAVVHEFWIWFGDSIMSAQVLDKWTAELIFSNVSSPVRNPGILTQSMPDRDGKVNYDLRLFPIKRNEKKRFKIQFLMPTRPALETLRVWLPTPQLLSNLTTPPKTLRIIYKYNDYVDKAPELLNTEIIQSSQMPLDSAWVFTIPLEFDRFIELSFPSPITDHVYFSTFQQNGENYYHLAVYPPNVTRDESPRHILIVIDYNRNNTDGLDGEFLLTSLKETIQQAFNPDDYLNLLIAYDDYILASPDWVTCTEENVDTLFAKIIRSTFPSYSHLQPLMKSAADFINSHVSPGSEVLLISNTNEISLSTTDRITLANDIIGMFPRNTKLHVFDLENKSGLNYVYNYFINYSSYYGETQLQSFYGRLTYATAGNLFYLRYHTFKNILNAFFYEQLSHFEDVEVQMEFQSGYSHSKHFLTKNQGYYPLHFPVMQVGKYTGQLPLHLRILGKIRSETFEDQYTIEENQVVKGSSQIVTSWYGDYIQSLLKLSYNPLTINDIIKYSIDQRILTPYSAFLVYNPDEKYAYCQDCLDETIMAVEDTTQSQPDTTMDFTAYPNPFNSQIKIEITLSRTGENRDFALSIFNILGQEVQNFDLNPLEQKHSIVWNAQDRTGRLVSTGIYFAVVHGNNMRKTMKLLYVR
jgi:hypothetical protein